MSWLKDKGQKGERERGAAGGWINGRSLPLAKGGCLLNSDHQFHINPAQAQ